MNQAKIERVAGLCAQYVRECIEQSHAERLADNKSAGFPAPMFRTGSFHPIDVFQDYFFGRKAEGAWGRVKPAEVIAIEARGRELLAAELEEHRREWQYAKDVAEGRIVPPDPLLTGASRRFAERCAAIPGPRSDAREPNAEPRLTRSQYFIDAARRVWQWTAWSGDDLLMVIEMPWGRLRCPTDRARNMACYTADAALWQLRDIVASYIRTDVRSSV